MGGGIRKLGENKRICEKIRKLSSQRAGPQKPMENHRRSIGSGRLPEGIIRKMDRGSAMGEKIRKFKEHKKMDGGISKWSAQRAGPQKALENHRKSIGSGRLPEGKIRKMEWGIRKWKHK